MGRLAARIARGIEHAARRWADVTIAVNRPIDQLLATRPAGSSERRILVHNSADPEDFGAPSPPVVRSGSDTLELIYHGTLMPLYGLDSAIRGVALAAFQGARVRLTILGNGPERSALRQLAQTVTENGVVTFESAIPQTALRERLRRADAGVVPTRLDSMTRFSLSNKLLEYVHLGLPVLASRLPSYENYFPNEALWYWEPGNPTDLARAIHEFVSTSPQVRGARPLRAQQALASIGWPVERARLISVYNDLIAGYPVRSAQGT
jgi:glycosyltransferase involved in cell wall biosynthesis